MSDGGHAALAEAHQAARATWPDVSLELGSFEAYVRERLGPDANALELARPHLRDLFLACACLAGDGPALSLLDDVIQREARLAAAKVDRSASFADEVRQELRLKLLVQANGATAKLGEYSGRAPIANWLRMAALRTALNLRRGATFKAEAPLEEALDLAGRSTTPEMKVMRQQGRVAFRGAFRTALARMPDKDRELLTLHLVQGLSHEEIGKRLEAHRATVARWLEAARQRLLDGIREILAQELQLNRREVESMAGLVRSQLDLSLSQLRRKPKK
ncbi:MAG: sigma-70 family RNA polymerase sigma factor [Deltaproteobacteria bacterium]|nr:sigma-70 family RNA polymerase sigma factor [Deltaproteobacteria bacterium]